MSDSNSSRAIKDFLAESEEILEQLNLDLVTLGDAIENGGEVDPGLLNTIFRGAHSFKGISGMFGFDDLCELCHHMENLLDSLRLGKVPLSENLVEILFSLLEVLTRLVHGKAESEDFTLDINPFIQRIDALLRGDEPSAPLIPAEGIDPAILRVLTEYEEHRLNESIKNGKNILRVAVNFSLMSFDVELAALTDHLKQYGEVLSTLPSAGDIPGHIGFQLLFGTRSTGEELAGVLQSEDIKIVCLYSAAEVVAPLGLPAKSHPSRPVEVEIVNKEGENNEEERAASLRSLSRTVRVDIDKLDNLMNIVGELVLSKSAITTIAVQLKQQVPNDLTAELQKATRGLERRLEELQQGVMDVRMVPISQIFDKMVRIIRRASNEQGKKITLDVRGAETELDKLIVEDLSDPLMHIIRNAVDHGIETPEERVVTGKSEKGTITLWAAQKGNHVVLEIGDDGRGIDSSRVRQKAIERGLISPEAELSQEDIYNLVFLPGFSTRDEVTDLSGRGVGMDVVKNNIAALSGAIEIDSEFGRGTLMTITLPITLAIIKALIVRVSGRSYAIPINSVLETLMIDASAIRTIERREVMELRQKTLPLLRLTEVFALPAAEKQGSARSFVVVTGMAEKRIGIMVDELIGQQDVVIKSLGKALSFVRGIAGAADLGNQKTILVLDVGGLMNEALRGELARHV
ncbi:MAG: chemotaxis protein CheA [Deltaproteobacteria bacterium HGW-Deltaproteobacteria-4]|nr:MAG: chemotaxis protein CheA [Deltaproteobacteria bacterium HGW-Deltaproteobacteria-4]